MSIVLAAAPALPLHRAGPYVAAAYIVFVVLLVVYLGIMGLRTSRTERQLAELRREIAERPAPGTTPSATTPDAPESGASKEEEAGSHRDREPVR